jgi:hypothetical protein
MKLKSNLTKRYYFPIVEGSNFGYVFNHGSTYNAFVTYIRSNNFVTKVTNYSQVWHWFANRAVQLRKGYYVGWWAEGEKMLRDLSKANKYLNRQYNRIDKHIRNGDLDKAIGVWQILHTRSRVWLLVLVVRKLPFLGMRVLRVQSLIRSVRALAWKESTRLRYKRVFLKEYKADGTLKKLRPLGVPSMEWRVLAASYEFILVNLWAKDWSENQYACMPGRGVADAWIEILRRFSKGNVEEVIGFDLAKFFDTVYLSNIVSIMSGLPARFVMWMQETMKVKPSIRPQDRKYEKERIDNTLRERPLDYYQEGQGEEFFLGGIVSLEKLMKGQRVFTPSELQADLKTGNGTGMKLPQYQNTGDVSLPQGLNTSPVIACKILQETGVLDNGNVIQYVDDGIIMNTKDSSYSLAQLRQELDTRYSGITLSETKTEVIYKDGKWIKPLKFLGCSYDGKTFVAHTRKGVYKVENAERRIQEIIYWLSKNGNLLGRYKKLMTSLISEGWNPSRSKFWSVPSKGFEGGLITSFSTWWEETKVKVERLAVNSVEAMSVVTLGPKLGPIMSSSNTATMVGSYYLLRFGETTKARRAKAVIKGEIREPNRLLADW